MIQTFFSSLLIAMACLFCPLHAVAAIESTDTQPSSLSEEKFRKLQKEMEGDAASRQTLDKGLPSKSNSGLGPSTPEPRSLPALAFQILMGLLFVLLLAVITIRVLKRLQGRMLQKPGKAGGEFFEVLETCHLGTHQKVVALRMNDEVGILGVTPQGISLISILKEPASEVRQSYARESNSAAFSENLNKLLDRFKKPRKVSDLLDEVKG